MLKFIQIALRWGISWLYFVCLICLFGAIAGVLTHSVYACFFVSSPDWAYYASFGFLNGLKYGGVWAGGAAIVLCVMRARKQYLARENAADESEVAS